MYACVLLFQIIPIESSMAENRPRFPLYLALSLVQYSIFLGSFGMLGYLIFADNTPQIVTSILPDAFFSQFVRAALVMAVLFTYPLQLFPVIEIAEDLIFTRVNPTDKSHLTEVIAGPSTGKNEQTSGQVPASYQSINGKQIRGSHSSRSGSGSSSAGLPGTSSEESQVLLQQPGPASPSVWQRRVWIYF